MIAWVKYKWVLGQLRRRQDETEAQILASKVRGKQEGWTPDEWESFEQGSQIDSQVAQALLDDHVTRYLVRRADQLMIPVPGRREDGMWERDLFDQWVLSQKGIYAIRLLMREENKVRMEYWKFLGGGLMALLSAGLGYFAGKGS